MRALHAIFALIFFGTSVSAGDQRKLLVISIGGLDYRYLKNADKLHLKIPVLRKLMAQGVVAAGVVGVVPCDDWAASTSLVTGVMPYNHGITGSNTVEGSIKATTLWQASMRANRKTAALYWPATLGAKVDYSCPELADKAGPDGEFDAISGKCTPGLVQRISSVYPGFSKTLWNDETTLYGLNYLLQHENPDLTLVHLTDLETEQRDSGALSLYSFEILENDDDLLGQVLRKLPPRTMVAVVSDHGMANEQYVLRPRVLIHSTLVEVRHGLIGATNAKDAAALRKLIGAKKTGIAREVPMNEVQRFSPDITSWVAAFGTVPGVIPSESEKGPAVSHGSYKSVDGVWPTQPDYRASFLLWGEDVRSGRIGEISMLEIAPTLADILGVKLPMAQHPSLWPRIRK